MSQVITKRSRVSRRAFLKGVTLVGNGHSGRAAAAGEHVQLAGHGVCRWSTAAGRSPRRRSRAGSCSGSTATASPSDIGFRAETGRDFELTPCLSPLAPFRNDIHVLTGLDNPRPRCLVPATATTNR